MIINTHFIPNSTNRYNPFLTVLDILMDNSLSMEYPQHLFKIFAKLLIICGVDSLTFSY
jgi:hypothetical protein